jgi:EmrB/QacA subfamily drug resistance transporter
LPTPGPARSRRPGRLLPLTSAAAFVAFLDVTVVNVAFPELARSFAGADVAELSWTVTAYAAMFAAALIPAGRVADALGHRRVLAAGVAAFALASAGCAMAPSLALLIAARALQGIAAAVITPASFGLLLAETPRSRRARAVGIWGAAAALSALLGPTLGGLVVEALGWRALFALNVPVGIAIVAGLGRAPRATPARDRSLPDAVGAVLAVAAIALVTIALTRGGEWGLSDPRVLAPLLIGIACLALALRRSVTSGTPVIDLGLLRDRTFALANAVSLLFALAAFSWLLAGPLFAASVWGYSPLSAAVSVAPGAVAASLASVLAGRVGDEARRRVVVAGSALFALTLLWLALALGDQPRLEAVWIPAGILTGIAIGSVLVSLSTLVAASVPRERFAAGAGMNMTARQLGGALGVALMAGLIASGGHASDYVDVWVLGAIASLGAGAAALPLLRRD